MKLLLTALTAILAGRAAGFETARNDLAAAVLPDEHSGVVCGALNRRAVLGAIQSVPGLAGSKIEIFDISREPVPCGELHFSLATLPTPAGRDCHSPVVWRAEVVYDANRRVPVWTKATICVPQVVVKTTRVIPCNTEITADMVEAATITTYPNGATPQPRSVGDVVGRKAVRRIQLGEVLEAGAIRSPDVIVRGQIVHVKVASGHVRLRIDGEAVSSARLGEIVMIRNAKTGNTFRAKADGRSSATIALGENGL